MAGKNTLEVVKEKKFGSAFAADLNQFINIHILAGYAASAAPLPGGGGWVVKILRFV